MKKKLIKLVAIFALIAMLGAMLFILPACNTDVGEDEQVGSDDNEANNSSIYAVDELKIGIIADPHVMAEDNLEDLSNNDYILFVERYANLKMNELSSAILKTSVDELIASDVDVVLMMGDLTLDGAINSLQIVADECQKLEDAGITVYATNGVCDINNGRTKENLSEHAIIHSESGYKAIQSIENTGKYAFQYTKNQSLRYTKTATKDDYLDMFANFGYNEAVSADPNSTSYAVDIPGTNYRLISLDNSSYYNEEKRVYLDFVEARTMPDDEKLWLENALLAAKSEGKDILVMSNIPIDGSPATIYSDFLSDTHLSIQNCEELEALLSSYDVRYVFNGQLHFNQVNDKNVNGKALTEVYTSNTTTYPCTIRYFDIASDYTYSTVTPKIGNLKAEYITSNAVSEETKLAASTGFEAYAEYAIKRDISHTFYKNVHRRGLHLEKTNLWEYIFTELLIYPTGDDAKDAALMSIGDDMIAWMDEVNDMKIYGEGDTVEAICKEYGITVPASRYTGYTTSDFVMSIFVRMLDNTFEKLDNGAETKIFTCIFKAGMKKIVSLNIFGRLHEANPLIRSCDLAPMMETLMTSDNIDLKKDDFLLALASFFFPYVKETVGITLNPQNSDDLLQSASIIMPILTVGIPDLALFANDEGRLETENYSVSKGIIYGKNFIENLLFDILARSCLVL